MQSDFTLSVLDSENDFLSNCLVLDSSRIP